MKAKASPVRVRFRVEMSGYVELDMHPDMAKAIDEALGEDGRGEREAFEVLEGRYMDEVLDQIGMDGELEDFEYVKPRKAKAGR